MRIYGAILPVLVLASTLLFGSCNYLQVLEQPDDKAITSEIQAKLFEDPVLKTRDIRVSTAKSVVTLNGTLNTELEKSAALRIATEAKGVQQVIDQLTVQAAPTTQAPVAEPPQVAALAPARTAEPAQVTAAAPAAPAEQPRPARRAERAAARPTAEAREVTEAEAVTAEIAAAPVAPPPRQPETVTIPAGTVVSVRMIDSIDSARHRTGEEFAASVDAPVVIGERVVIPRGSDARVRLVESRTAGRMTGRSELTVELVGLAIGSQTYSVESGAYQKVGASRGKRTATTVGGGAALGALIGAIAGKGKGAAIGAAVGAGAGTGVQAATKGEQVQIPSETKLDFTLRVPITLTM